MGVDFDILAEFFADVAFQLMGDVVGGCQGHIAVDFEVDADGQLAAEIVHGDVMDGETGIARDHHDAFAHALIVARDRHRGEGEVGSTWPMPSMKWVAPTIRALKRSTSTTPGTALIAAAAFSDTPSGARSSRGSTVERA